MVDRRMDPDNDGQTTAPLKLTVVHQILALHHNQKEKGIGLNCSIKLMLEQKFKATPWNWGKMGRNS